MIERPSIDELPAGSLANTVIGVLTSWSYEQREERDAHGRIALHADGGAGESRIRAIADAHA